MNDSFYTPQTLAKILISSIKKRNIKSIADFCVGEGDLLIAAKGKWKNAQFYGNDISRKVIQSLKRKHTSWKLGNCDFLDSNSKGKSNLFNKKFDLILLNPPFTCKGSSIHIINFDNKEYHTSTAMAFFVESIKYLNNDGILYAILPQSIAYSQKDERIREHLFKNYNFKIFSERNNQGFENCTPNIVLAAVNDKNVNSLIKPFPRINTKINNIEVVRGRLGMHKIKNARKNTLPLIHSTNIRKNSIINIKYNVRINYSIINGPAILICRVGQPSVEKICLVPARKKYALSDCIIGIKVKTEEDCKRLKQIIFNNWDNFSNLYKGTGAKYITIKRLKYFLNLD